MKKRNKKWIMEQRRFIGRGADWLCKHGNHTIVMSLLISLIQNLNPTRYREVLKSIIRAVVVDDDSSDGREIDSLMKTIIRSIDYTLKQERHEEEMAIIRDIIA